jgi:hypothetical protein
VNADRFGLGGLMLTGSIGDAGRDVCGRAIHRLALPGISNGD